MDKLVEGMSYELVTMPQYKENYLVYQRVDRKKTDVTESLRKAIFFDGVKRRSTMKHTHTNVKFNVGIMRRMVKIKTRLYRIPDDFYPQPSEEEIILEIRKEAAAQLKCHLLQVCYCPDADLKVIQTKLGGGGVDWKGRRIPVLGIHEVIGTMIIPDFSLPGIESVKSQTVEVKHINSNEFYEKGRDWVSVAVPVKSPIDDTATVYFITSYEYDFTKGNYESA